MLGIKHDVLHLTHDYICYQERLSYICTEVLTTLNTILEALLQVFCSK